MFGIKNWGKYQTETDLRFSDLIQTEYYIRAYASIPDDMPLVNIPKINELIESTIERKRKHLIGFTLFLIVSILQSS